MLKKNEIVKLTIDKMTFEGLGVAHYNDEECKNFAVFVHSATVGEILDCRVVKVLPKYAFAIPENFDLISDVRIEPSCKTYRRCGGCSFSHIIYPAEVSFKREFVEDAFHKNFHGNTCKIEDVISSPQEEFYRNKAQFPISPAGKCGFFAKNTHRIVEIEKCYLNDEAFDTIVETFEEYISKYKVSCYNEETGKGLLRHFCIRRAPKTGEIMIIVVVNGQDIPHKEQLTSALSEHEGVKSIYMNINTKNTNVILSRECRLLWGKETIRDELCGMFFDISPLSFYQVNSPQAENIYNYIKEILQLTKKDIVLDLYSGIGTIGLILSPEAKKVIGIEIVEQAVSNAAQNMLQNNVENYLLYLASASETRDILSLLQPEDRPNIVVVDPPRKGLDDETIRAVININPEKFVYVSCNPATLARDLNTIISTDPSYKVKKIQPFDMFPRTTHVECVVLLSKEKN
ncbi:MAG: 23S rRNA (uracil(1939)-C(5))-methyltransferase RlmD [Clostridiales bacterium]|nr:MAG: 23S rRNA (uracil(1939)-C(5))-methyltransferase RlmD [Clostridiales bacterium]